MIQSLSIVVPNRKCINNCAFCVSKMYPDEYRNQMDENLPFFDLYFKDYMKRLEYAKEMGVETVMLTGNSEPQQNRKFLMFFGLMMQMMDSPFRRIEMQTTGAGIDRNYLRFLRNHVGVNVISVSVSSFDDGWNNEIIGGPLKIDLKQLCANIKEYDFSLRLSINLSLRNFREGVPSAKAYFQNATALGADQITFRVLYTSELGTEQDKWIQANRVTDGCIEEINEYIKGNGRFLEILPFGQKRYSVHGMSTVVDGDCMNTEAKENLKYLILQPDCKLYSKWDDRASLVF